MVTKRALLLLLGLGALPLIGSYLWLFRTVTYDNPALGIIEQRYKWGYAAELSVDTNRDGRVDALAVFPTGNRTFDAHSSPQEIREDRDADGKFEIHAVLEGGTIVLVELDNDSDGQYDESLDGAEAVNFFTEFLAVEQLGASGITKSGVE